MENSSLNLNLLANIATQILQQQQQQQQLKELFDCNICHYKYTTKRGIREHLQKKHGIWCGQQIKPPNNDCPFCKIPHQNNITMIRHIYSIHSEFASEWYKQLKQNGICKFCSNTRCCCDGVQIESIDSEFTIYMVPLSEWSKIKYNPTGHMP